MYCVRLINLLNVSVSWKIKHTYYVCAWNYRTLCWETKIFLNSVRIKITKLSRVPRSWTNVGLWVSASVSMCHWMRIGRVSNLFSDILATAAAVVVSCQATLYSHAKVSQMGVIDAFLLCGIHSTYSSMEASSPTVKMDTKMKSHTSSKLSII